MSALDNSPYASIFLVKVLGKNAHGQDLDNYARFEATS